MANRYASRPYAAFLLINEDGTASMTADTILIEDEEYRPSGLLDRDGNKLYRVRERVPFGFVKG